MFLKCFILIMLNCDECNWLKYKYVRISFFTWCNCLQFSYTSKLSLFRTFFEAGLAQFKVSNTYTLCHSGSCFEVCFYHVISAVYMIPFSSGPYKLSVTSSLDAYLSLFNWDWTGLVQTSPDLYRKSYFCCRKWDHLNELKVLKTHF